MVFKVLRALEDSGIPYCILHGWQRLGENGESDLDIAVPPDSVGYLSSLLCGIAGIECLQLIRHESSCYYFVLAEIVDNAVHFLRLDVASDFRRDGRIFLTSRELLDGRRKEESLWISSARTEISYLMIKKVLKGKMPGQQIRRLQMLLDELGGEGDKIAQGLFGRETGSLFLSLIHRNDTLGIKAAMPRLKRTLLRRTFLLRPINILRYWMGETQRIMHRLHLPTGLFVSILGPDGAGKTTLIKRLEKEIAAPFRRGYVFHCRPGFFRMRGGKTSTLPHGERQYGLLLSIIKLMYLILDYGLGFVFKIHCMLVRSSLVLFDRYYDDLQVDPRRSRYGGPVKLVRFLRPLVPDPDLYLILDVPEEQLLLRKAELPLEELRKLRFSYRTMAEGRKNAILLDGTASPDDVAFGAGKFILHFLKERYLRFHRKTFTHRLEPVRGENSLESSTFVLPEERGRHYASFSIKGGRNFLIPLTNRAAALSGLGLYCAYTLKAKAFKNLLVIWIRIGMIKPFLSTIAPRDRFITERLFSHLTKVINRRDVSFAVSWGTPGAHQKPVIQVMESGGRIIAYVKEGWNRETRDLVRHETEILRELSSCTLSSFLLPEVIHVDEWEERLLLFLSTPKGNPRPAPKEMTSDCLAILCELRALNVKNIRLEESQLWKELLTYTGQDFDHGHSQLWEEGKLFLEKSLKNHIMQFHLCHGDFTPWNMRVLDGRRVLFDWEYSMREGPPGYDLIHFHYQSSTLLHSRGQKKIFSDLLGIARALRHFGGGMTRIEPLLLLYFMHRLTRAMHENKQETTMARQLWDMLHMFIERKAELH
jgi:thymidylate kinase